MLIRVRSISVTGLFGLYNHKVSLFLEDRVTILHGPNGVGKTVLLKLIHALFSQDYPYLISTPYDQIRVSLDDESLIVVDRQENRKKKADATRPLEVPATTELSFTLTSNQGQCGYYLNSQQIDYDGWAEAYAEQAHNIFRSASNRWIDHLTDQVFTSRELYQRYGSEASAKHSMPMTMELSIPEPFKNIYARVNTFFIEAQRLIRTTPGRSRRTGRLDDNVTVAVTQDAQELSAQLKEALFSYSMTVQELDQTFPRRLFQGSHNGKNLNNASITESIEKLEKERDRLNLLGVLDVMQPSYPFSGTNLTSIDASTAQAMVLYVADSREKLAVLSKFANRVEPLIRSINNRFTNKRLKLDRERGLVAISVTGDEISPDQLSSGEQHEIVLLYALLFRVQQNSLILIDEPELSLHIDWQRQFLPELLTIANRTGFDALVATHSSSIVSERADLMIGLSAEARARHA